MYKNEKQGESDISIYTLTLFILLVTTEALGTLTFSTVSELIRNKQTKTTEDLPFSETGLPLSVQSLGGSSLCFQPGWNQTGCEH